MINKHDGISPICKGCAIIKARKVTLENPEKKKGYYDKAESKPQRIKYMREHSARQRKEGKQAEWQRKNPEKLKEYGELHHDHTISPKQWTSCKEYFSNKCAYCGLKLKDHYFTRMGITKNGDFHKEHVIHNGENDLSNCVPACSSCNFHKWKFDLEDWYREYPRFSRYRLNKIHKWLDEDYKLYL